MANLRSQAIICLLSVSSALAMCSVYAGNAIASSETCESAIQNVTGDMRDRLGAEVTEVMVRPAEYPFSPFPNAKDEVLIVLYRAIRNSDSPLPSDHLASPDRLTHISENIMNSPSLLTEYSTQIIQGCDPVARVTFGLRNSGYLRSFSYRPDKTVAPDTCLDPVRGENRDVAWGQSVCVD